MGKDLSCVIGSPYPLPLVFGQELEEEVDHCVRILDVKVIPRREHHPSGLDLRHEHLAIGVKEWARPEQHLEDEYADGPPVDHSVVACACDDLWSEVLSRPTERHCRLAMVEVLGETKVYDLDVAVCVDHDVLQLDVAVHDAALVELAQGHDDLSSVELYHVLWKDLFLLKDSVKFASTDERQHEVEPSLTLEQVLHATEERVVCIDQNVLFQCRVGDLIMLDQFVFSDHFDGIFLALIRQFGQEDFSKGTLANLSLDHKVLQLDLYRSLTLHFAQ